MASLEGPMKEAAERLGVGAAPGPSGRVPVFDSRGARIGTVDASDVGNLPPGFHTTETPGLGEKVQGAMTGLASGISGGRGPISSLVRKSLLYPEELSELEQMKKDAEQRVSLPTKTGEIIGGAATPESALLSTALGGGGRLLAGTLARRAATPALEALEGVTGRAATAADASELMQGPLSGMNALKQFKGFSGYMPGLVLGGAAGLNPWKTALVVKALQAAASPPGQAALGRGLATAGDLGAAITPFIPGPKKKEEE